MVLDKQEPDVIHLVLQYVPLTIWTIKPLWSWKPYCMHKGRKTCEIYWYKMIPIFCTKCLLFRWKGAIHNILFTIELPRNDAYHCYWQPLLKALECAINGGNHFNGWVQVPTHQIIIFWYSAFWSKWFSKNSDYR